MNDPQQPRSNDSSHQPALSLGERLAGLEASAGAWSDRQFDGESYVRSIRHGVKARLDRLEEPASEPKNR